MQGLKGGFKNLIIKAAVWPACLCSRVSALPAGAAEWHRCARHKTHVTQLLEPVVRR